MPTRYRDFYSLFDTLDYVEQQLTDWLEPAIDGLQSTPARPCRLTGLAGYNTQIGYVILRLGQRTISVWDGWVVYMPPAFIPIDVPIPIGEKATVWVRSQTGTLSIEVRVNLRYEEG